MKEYLEYTQIKTADDLARRIKKIEAMIRNSYEYKCWVKSIHEDLEINHCDYFKEWSDDEIDMEVHHIITLFDIVLIVGLKLLDNLQEDEYLLTFDVAKQVMEEHLANRIPVILVSKTIHQAIHEGLYQPSPESKSLNLGDYKEFVKEYKDHICITEMVTLSKYLKDEDIKDLEEIYGQEIKLTEDRSL